MPFTEIEPWLHGINDKLDGITHHLEKLNGTVLEHEVGVTAIGERLAAMGEKIQVLENSRAAIYAELARHQSYIDERKRDVKELEEVKETVARHENQFSSQGGAWRLVSQIGAVIAGACGVIALLLKFSGKN